MSNTEKNSAAVPVKTKRGNAGGYTLEDFKNAKPQDKYFWFLHWWGGFDNLLEELIFDTGLDNAEVYMERMLTTFAISSHTVIDEPGEIADIIYFFNKLKQLIEMMQEVPVKDQEEWHTLNREAKI